MDVAEHQSYPLVAPEINVEWQVATSESFAPGSVIGSGLVKAEPVRSNCLRVTVTVSDLMAAQVYYYRFLVVSFGQVSPVGSFITSPEGECP